MTTGEPPPSLGEEISRGREELNELGASAADIASDLRMLAATELELMRAEISENVGLAVRSAILGTAAFVFGVLALAFLSVAAMRALDEVLPLWVSALVVAGALALIAAVAALLAYGRVKQISIAPVRTLRSWREALRWARAQMRLNGR